MEPAPPRKRTQGMNWVRQTTRLAVYLRDGLACVYCGADDDRLTLDHLVPYSQGGTNCPSNLVTCCMACNSARGARPLADWVASLNMTTVRVRAFARRPLPRAEARALLAAHKTVAEVLRTERVALETEMPESSPWAFNFKGCVATWLACPRGGYGYVYRVPVRVESCHRATATVVEVRTGKLRRVRWGSLRDPLPSTRHQP